MLGAGHTSRSRLNHNAFFLCLRCFCSQHRQRESRHPPGAEQAEDQDPGGSGADLQHAGHRHQPRGATTTARFVKGSGAHQEPAAAEIQELMHVRSAQSILMSKWTSDNER